MKKQLLLVVFLLITAIPYAQKKELKKAEKAISSGNFAEAYDYINQAEGLLGSASSSEKIDFYLIKSKVFLVDAGKGNFEKLKKSAEALLKIQELNPNYASNDDYKKTAQNLRVSLVNSAIEDQNAKKYDQASERLYLSYQTNKQDTSDLYYAAGNAVNAKNYPLAIEHYKKLLDLDYTGISKEYIATNIKTGEIEVFADIDDRKVSMLSGNYTNPTERMSESSEGDILGKVTLIYISQGENEKAKELMDKARAANPSDTNLMRADADLTYKMGDMVKYDRLMNEIVKSDPKNPELYYNLGVSASQIGETEKAMGYYKKALEIKPDYGFAHINLAAIMLQNEGAIVEEMNGLGDSNADDKRYDELKQKRKDLYEEVLPHLESAYSHRKDNVELVRTLMNIYSQVGNDSKFKEMKERLAALEQ